MVWKTIYIGPPRPQLFGGSIVRFLQMMCGCLAVLMAAVIAGQNTSTVSLILFSFQSVELPLGLVLMGALVAGIVSSMLLVGIFSKTSRPVRSAMQSLKIPAR